MQVTFPFSPNGKIAPRKMREITISRVTTNHYECNTNPPTAEITRRDLTDESRMRMLYF